MKRLHIFDHDAYHDALQHQVGNGIPVFTGYRQDGGGLGNILGFISRYIVPLLKNHVLPHARTAAINTMADVINGQSFKKSINSHTQSMIKNVGNSISKRQTGSGLDSINTIEDIPLRSVHALEGVMPCSKRKKKVSRDKKTRITKKKKPIRAKPKTTRKKYKLTKQDIFS